MIVREGDRLGDEFPEHRYTRFLPGTRYEPLAIDRQGNVVLVADYSDPATFDSITAVLHWRVGEGLFILTREGLGTPGEPFEDIDRNGLYSPEEFFVDLNENGRWDTGERFRDYNARGVTPDPAEPFTDLNDNGRFDAALTFLRPFAALMNPAGSITYRQDFDRNALPFSYRLSMVYHRTSSPQLFGFGDAMPPGDSRPRKVRGFGNKTPCLSADNAMIFNVSSVDAVWDDEEAQQVVIADLDSWVGGGEEPIVLWTKNAPAPGYPTDVLNDNMHISSFAAGSHFAFRNFVKGPGITSASNEAIYAGRESFLSRIMTEGESFSIDGVDHVVQSMSSPVVCESGSVAFSTLLDGGDTVIWRWRIDGSLTPVAWDGDPAPWDAAHTFNLFSGLPLLLLPDGTMVVEHDGSRNGAVFGISDAGEAFPIAELGTEIDLGGEGLSTLYEAKLGASTSALWFHNAGASGYGSPASPDGHLLLRVTLEDRRTEVLAVTRISPGPPPERVQVLDVSVDDGEIRLSHVTLAGKRYRFEQSPDLLNWTTIGAEFDGTDGMGTSTFPLTGEARYFRLTEIE